MPGTFDVFFSYHTVDHATVTQVAQRLHDRGIHVFLDRWYLAGGQPWQPELERTLASCGAVAVFLGAEGLGPWQQRERDLALDRQGREPGFPVIPVLLSRTDPPLGFLKLNTWVDLSAGAADNTALEILTAAIRRQSPGTLALQQITAVLAEVCPYRGLRPFREEDEPFFFGRAAFTETLATTLARQSFVAVVGASGSGKSSVVRAGLIPRLRRGEGGRIWEAVSFVPTDQPLHSLAKSLLQLLEPDLTEVDRLAEVGKLARHLVEGDVRLRDVTSRILEKQPGTERLLLFADQWEELYTLCTDEAIRTAFVAQLLEVARSAAVTVVLTLRGDFMSHVLAHRELSDRLQDSIVTIGPMTRNELAETITKPAEKMGLAFEPGLVETILDDVGAPVCVAEGQEELKIGEHEPGNLPLLEFLLEALWKERRGAFLHYDAYHRLGRVSGAIAHRAEEVFQHKLTEAERQAAQRLLIRMVRAGEGVEDTRQRAAIPESDPVAETTIRKLADARLVVTEQDAASGRETVEVAHEALIRGWQRLRGWVDQDRKFLRTRERIAVQARLWEHEGKPPDRLLPPGLPLAEGEDLLATRRADLDADLITYIAASATAAKAQEDAKRAVQRRRLHKARLAAAAMSLLALVAIGGGTIAWWQRGEARAAQDEAERNFRHAVDTADALVTQVAKRLQPLAGIQGVSATTLHDILMNAENQFMKLTALAPDSRALRDREAAMLMAFAETYGVLNDTAERTKRAEKAHQIMQALVDEEPHKDQWRYGLALSHLSLGDALEAQGKFLEALAAYRNYRANMERLVAQDPANIQWNRDLAISKAKVGLVLSTQGDLAGAVVAFRGFQKDTKTLLEQSAVDPKLQRNLSRSQFLVSYAATDSSEQILKALRSYQATVKQLIENDPGNTVWKDDMASIHNGIGLFLKNRGDLKGAQEEHDAALQIMKLLASNDPRNVDWQAGLARSYEAVSSMLQLQNNIHGALDTGAIAMTIWDSLATQDSDNPHWKYSLAMSHAQIAAAKRLLGDPIGAISGYNTADKLLHTLSIDVDPTYVEWQYQLSSMKNLCGAVLFEQSDMDGARAKFVEANEILQDLAARDPSNTRTHSMLVENLNSLVMVAEDRVLALEYAGKSQETAERLIGNDPTNTDFRYLLSRTQDAIGDILRSGGDLTGALSSYHAAQKTLEDLTHSDSVQSLWRMNLVSVYCDIAGILYDKNDLYGASAAYSRAKAMIDDMTNHVHIDAVQFPLKRVHSGLGRIKDAQGDWAGALKEYKKSNAITEQQAASYPSRDDLKVELALNQKILSLLRTKNGDQVGALEASRSALTILEPVVQRDPDNMQKWELLRHTMGALVDMSHALTRYGEAVLYNARWVALCRQRKAKTGKNGSELAAALGNLSWHYIVNGQFKEAEAAAREGYELDPQKNWILINLAHAEMFLGRQEAAMEMHTQHLNDVVDENGNRKWKEVVADNFATLKKAGIEHEAMQNMEQLLSR